MDAAKLGESRFLNLLFKPAGWLMESRLRQFFQDPERILDGADLKAGQTVLEVGSGTGFFTLPAAKRIGTAGRLVAMEPLLSYTERLSDRLAQAGLGNVDIVRRDALDTGLDDLSIDRAILFGVLPHATLPLNRLLPEMHRVLKPDGTMAVWLFPIAGLVPNAILRSGLFFDQHKQNGVYRYRRSVGPA